MSAEPLQILFRPLRILLLLCSLTSAAHGKNLLLICPKEWQQSLSDYQSLRRSQGWQVHILNPEAPRFEIIHHQICCYFWKYLPADGHLLLVGDSLRIPHAPAHLDSDLPYCFMDGTADPLPDWTCGRIPVSSRQELRQYLDHLPRNAILPREQLLIDSEKRYPQPKFLPQKNLPYSAVIHFSHDDDSLLSEIFQNEWDAISAAFPDLTLGEIFLRTCLGFYGQVPRYQADQFLRNVHFTGDATLLLHPMPASSPKKLTALRHMPGRLNAGCRQLTISLRLQIPGDRQKFLLIREQLPYGWQTESVNLNQNTIQFVQEGTTLKMLIQVSGGQEQMLQYRLQVSGCSGELYIIRGTAAEGEILHPVSGASALTFCRPRKVLEMSLSPGWNLLCFHSWPAPEECRAYPTERLLQLDSAARCWIQCTLETLQPEQGFWFFQKGTSPAIRQWLTDGSISAASDSNSPWHLSDSGSSETIQWNWQNHQYRRCPPRTAPFHGIWTRKR